MNIKIKPSVEGEKLVDLLNRVVFPSICQMF